MVVALDIKSEATTPHSDLLKACPSPSLEKQSVDWMRPELDFSLAKVLFIHPLVVSVGDGALASV